MLIQEYPDAGLAFPIVPLIVQVLLATVKLLIGRVIIIELLEPI